MKTFLDFIKEDRVSSEISNFTQEEKDLVDDIFLKYADDYRMKEMPIVTDEEGDYQVFQEVGVDEFSLSYRDVIQYSVSRYKNLGIDIQWVEEEIDGEIINKLMNDLKTDFKKRLSHFGFDLFYINKFPEKILFGNDLVDCRSINMTIIKK
jgi:hypothetical protein